MGGDEHGPMGRIEILATWAPRARTFGGPLSDRVGRPQRNAAENSEIVAATLPGRDCEATVRRCSGSAVTRGPFCVNPISPYLSLR